MAEERVNPGSSKKKSDGVNNGFVKFLGTAGARFVMIKQLRSSGGTWLNYNYTNILIDPGPGSIIRCNSARPKLELPKLDAIILTHKHLDHAGDVNVMIESMTEGGYKKRGLVFLPSDALGQDGVVYTYLQDFMEKIIILDRGRFSAGNINFEVPVQNVHPVLTFGLKFYLGSEIVSFMSDTKYFDGLLDAYKDSTVLILNVVFFEKRPDYPHLSLEEAVHIVEKIKPKKAIFTHFGMGILKEKPHILEEKIKKDLTGTDLKFAYDGMTMELPLEK